MTPEEKKQEEELAALVAANIPALRAADTVTSMNAGHIFISKRNQRFISLTVDPAERRHGELLAAIRDLKPKPRPFKKDVVTGESLVPRREKKCEKCARLEKFFREQIKALALLRDRDYYKFRKHINTNTKQKMAKLVDMPVSSFGRLVNGNEVLAKLCSIVMDEELFKNFLGLRSRVV